jgi:hypothetical protein
MVTDLNNKPLVLANGGLVRSIPGVGGKGGQAALSIGTVKFSGGDGGKSIIVDNKRIGGGGGGGAGPNGAGANGADATMAGPGNGGTGFATGSNGWVSSIFNTRPTVTQPNGGAGGPDGKGISGVGRVVISW